MSNPAGVDGVGAGYSVTSGGLSVLMDQPTESISSHDAPSRHEGKWFAGPQRCRLPQSAMRAMAVVVIGVLVQHRHQMPTSENKHPIQHLTPDGAVEVWTWLLPQLDLEANPPPR